MAQEIERKFLLDGVPDGLASCASTRIEQGYVALAGDVEVRLRRAGEERLLAVKRGHGEVREEVEVALEGRQFDALWPLTAARRLAKTRYLVPLREGLRAEVDVFEGGLAGLVLAEVEFADEAGSRGFRPPPWLRLEVTGDERYAGRSLATNGGPPAAPEGSMERQDGDVSEARAYRLKRKEGVADGVRRIARGRAESAREELAGASEGEELAEAIHAARKDMKKLRAVLRLVRERLGEETFRAENRRYRDAGRLLAASRDAEVKVETLAALEERFGEEMPTPATREWRMALEAERDEVAGAAAGEVAARIEAARASLAQGIAAIPSWPLAGGSWKLIEPGLLRSYRRGRREWVRTRSRPSAESVHEWRKRVKDLWYQLRLVHRAWPATIDEMATQAHELADLLGDHHDLTVLAVDLRERAGVGDREALAAPIERRQRQLLDAALELGARLFAEKPKAFRARLRAYWLAWRG